MKMRSVTGNYRAGRACGGCGASTRGLHAQAKAGNKNSRAQRTRWFVCENGHKSYQKGG